jgi:RimJ/RimL family protein N-acetyltransferase
MEIAVKIRPWSMDDLDDLVEGANNPRVAEWLTDGFPSPYTEADGRAFIASFAADDPCRVFAIEVDGCAVGSIGVFPQSDVHRRNAEMGYWLAEKYWGRGIVAKAIEQIVDYGFATFDVDRIFARPFGCNIRSHRVLQKAGFVLESRFEGTLVKNGRREDELYFSVRRRR